MKVLLVVEKEITKKVLTVHLKPRGFEFIHYRNPLKAMDNIEEVDPDIVLFSAEDFPRHWKPFLKLLRESRSKEDTVFILLIGDEFPFEEAAKAVHLKVNGIIGEDLQDNRKMRNFEGLLSRYKLLKDKRTDSRYIPENYDEIEFVFTHPQSMKLIIGEIDDISTSGLSFAPDTPSLVEDIEPETEIPYCSLRVEEHIISLNCKVVRNHNSVVAFSFIDISSNDRQILDEYIKNKPDRELQQYKKKTQAS
jgi:hypothetical protein